MMVHEVCWGERRRRVLRVVIADDAALVREGVAALLRDHGVEVAATAADAAGLHEAVARHLPDVALVDIRMPPTFTDEGLVAAERIRAGFPGVGVLVLSQHLDARYALRVADASPARTGYLLKDRVSDSRVLFEALERISAGGCVIDEAVAEGLVTRASALARIDELTEREREVLALVAEGRSNRGDRRALGGDAEDGRDPHRADLPQARAARRRGRGPPRRGGPRLPARRAPGGSLATCRGKTLDRAKRPRLEWRGRW